MHAKKSNTFWIEIPENITIFKAPVYIVFILNGNTACDY